MTYYDNSSCCEEVAPGSSFSLPKCDHSGASCWDHWNDRRDSAFNREEDVMSRTAICGLVCTIFLPFPGFPAAPQESARGGGLPRDGIVEDGLIVGTKR